MQFSATKLPEVKIVEPRVFSDERGYFMETHHRGHFAAAGIHCDFLQQNQSFSRAGVLRGLHYQIGFEQAKLVRAVTGCVLDVAVDMRRGSPRFAQWVAVELSAENQRMLYVPAGFAHGFCAIEQSVVVYACSDLYHPEAERGVIYDDATLAIPWPKGEFLLTDKDLALPALDAIGEADLPVYGG
ncbi:MAG: dTDP-4-dehydrorhamnose 3,5-epimerase [Deltaproteobacteria bacterium]|nr:dTDP-4-dehydrorhamnose 3,5-epimerase [Deltaproteobacteria bacterium]